MSGLVEGIAANTAGMQVSGQAAVQQAPWRLKISRRR
jgi:hypothetical protein